MAPRPKHARMPHPGPHGSCSNVVRRPLHLRLYPDAVLRQVAQPIQDVNRHIAALARDMLQLMRECRGIGLAAPQVGLLVRLIVADIGDGPVAVVNPRIAPSGAQERMIEGCLSLPDVYVDIARDSVLEVRGLAPDGAHLHFQARGLLARVIQHEVDHLQGVLICDRGTPRSADQAFGAPRPE